MSMYANDEKDSAQITDAEGTSYQQTNGVHRLATSAFTFQPPQASTSATSATTSFVPSPATGKTWTPEDLSKLTRESLRAIAKQEGVSVGKRKADTVANILVMCKPAELSNQDRILQHIESTSFRGRPSQHDLYRAEFNSVDLHNRQWYKNNLRIQVKHWRTKLVLSVMQQATINATTIVNEFRSAKRYNVRKDIQEHLLHMAGPIRRSTSRRPQNGQNSPRSKAKC